MLPIHLNPCPSFGDSLEGPPSEEAIELGAREPSDEAQHFVVVVADDVRAPIAHHRFGTPPALIHPQENPLLRGRFKASAALPKDSGDELGHLLTQGLIGDGLVEDPVELAVRAFKATQELVADELWRDFLDGDVRGSIALLWDRNSDLPLSITALYEEETLT